MTIPDLNKYLDKMVLKNGEVIVEYKRKNKLNIGRLCSSGCIQHMQKIYEIIY